MLNTSQTIAERLKSVQTRLQDAATKAKRDDTPPLLLAVSKTKPAAAIKSAYIAGQRDFGENYLQEALEKQEALAQDPELGPLCWHFIGPIQSNKTRSIAEHFDWVHSVDRQKIATRLAQQRPKHLPALNICLQVNLDAEASKAGISLAELPSLAAAIDKLEGIRLRGLMAIPAKCEGFDAQQQSLARLQRALAGLQDQGLALDTLSMGMSADLEAAVAAGSTIVRIGTDIFGPRQTPTSTTG